MILRIVLGQPAPLADWTRVLDVGITSALSAVESARALDRLFLTGTVAATTVAHRSAAVHDLMRAFRVLDVTGSVLARASSSFSVPLGTLDAIHLASALLWRESTGETITFATHDRTLALAARSVGFEVAG